MMRSATVLTTVLAATTLARADYYFDAAGDLADPGLVNLDIVGAEITNDDTFLVVAIDVADLNADWGKYVMLIDHDPSIGETANPWGRDIATSAAIDAFMGGWLDGGGGGLAYRYDDSISGWADAASASVSIDWDNNRITYTMGLGDLGLSIGDSFSFDIGTTGGGETDPAIDLLSTADLQPGWGNGSSSPMAYSYTVVPAPGAIALLGIATLVGGRRRN